MALSFPQAHLLGLPLELREQIYSHLTSDTPRLHMHDATGSVHLSAAHTPPIGLLRARSTLYHEALDYFHRNHHVALHVDAYAYARLRDKSMYARALERNTYLRRLTVLDLRPTLNADIEHLGQAMRVAVNFLSTHCSALKEVKVHWAEAKQFPFQQNWSPWAYKAPALGPLKKLAPRVTIVAGDVIVPPPRDYVVQQHGLQKAVARLRRRDDLKE